MDIKKLIAGLAIAGMVGVGFMLQPAAAEITEQPAPIEVADGPVIDSRAWNADTIKNPDGTFTSEIHGKWVNYLAPDGWKPIDMDFQDCGDMFCMKQAPFEVYVAKDSEGAALFVSNNRWDLIDGVEIADPPMNMGIRALNVASVPGEIERGDLGWGEISYVIYKGAYPGMGADLIYFAHHGRSPRLMKLVRFNGPVLSDQDIQFELAFESDPDIKTERKTLTATRKANIEAKMDEALALEDSGKIIESRQANREARELEMTDWTGVADLNTSKAIAMRPVDAVDTERGIGLEDFSIWDSAEEQKNEPLDVTLEKTADGYLLTKHVPASFFTGVTYPVYTDTTSTFYPDPDAESTSVDSAVEYQNDPSTWAAIVAGAGSGVSNGPSSGDDSIGKFYSSATANRWNVLRRGIFLFDTSAITDTDTISSGTFSIFGTIKADGLGVTPEINVYSSAPASNTNVVAGDFDSLGTTAFATAITYAGFSTAGYNDFTLNASGLAAITKTGVTKFGTRAVADATAAEPTYSASLSAGFDGNYADYTGTSNDPKLVVVHAAAPTAQKSKAIMILE